MEYETDERAEKLAVDELWAGNFGTRERAFALATRLTYQKWVSMNHNPPLSERFWHEVRTLFALYERARDAALCCGAGTRPDTRGTRHLNGATPQSHEVISE